MHRSAENRSPIQRRPDWLRPSGVPEGTWQYAQQRTIADHYGRFVAGTPLCRLDLEILQAVFAPVTAGEPARTIIDFGCGNGRAAIPLVRLGYNVIGVDLSDAMLGQLAKAAKNEASSAKVDAGERNLGRVHGVRANLVQLSCFADQSADDAICLFSTLGMIQGQLHRRRFLSNAARIVRPGGRLVLHVHHVWSAFSEPGGTMRLLRAWWRSHCDGRFEMGDHVYRYRGLSNMFLHRYSRRELAGDLRASGWRIDTLHRISLDGSRVVPGRLTPPSHVGGFIVVARR